ncbi:MAG: hypothetical protein MR707_04895 [Galactobacillus timonensis]|uniref:hypothetical protein n=1 Tax=Galactobacillus timonensis TaxID=2041840 RepID=UPI0023F5172C|nr:hypothetical protein [Galactobacillus timonensis]MCI6067550.1 hypothetical protein [Galactobacillus timonensis]
MKTWKLVSGILSIVFACMILFQSCAATVGDALQDAGGTSGASGMFVAIFVLAGGIVSLSTRDKETKGGNIALIVLFLLAALFAFSATGIFEDLKVWGSWSLICAVLAIISMIKKKK